MSTAILKPIGRRERRREATSQRILSAAIRLFEKQGFSATTVEQITEAADVGKGTFFNYFPSKDHVLLSLFAMLGGEFDRLQQEAPSVKDVRAHLREFARNLLASPGRTNVLRNVMGVAMTEPVIGRAFEGLIEKARSAVRHVMEHGQELQQVRSDITAADMARNFQQFILGTEVVYSINGAKGDLNQWVDQMFEIFWTGANTRPSSPKQNNRRK
jgi:AcrR family transcriptional regulator